MWHQPFVPNGTRAANTLMPIITNEDDDEPVKIPGNDIDD